MIKNYHIKNVRAYFAAHTIFFSRNKSKIRKAADGYKQINEPFMSVCTTYVFSKYEVEQLQTKHSYYCGIITQPLICQCDRMTRHTRVKAKNRRGCILNTKTNAYVSSALKGEREKTVKHEEPNWWSEERKKNNNKQKWNIKKRTNKPHIDKCISQHWRKKCKNFHVLAIEHVFRFIFAFFRLLNRFSGTYLYLRFFRSKSIFVFH